MDRVLVIAAHPDDDILGCGGTLSKIRSGGSEVRVVFIAEGTTCRFTDCVITEEAKTEIKKRESYAVSALEVLGIQDVSFYNLPCGRLDQYPIIEINKIIESEIAGFKPDTILTHSSVDANSDHRKVHESVIMATRPGALNYIKRILCFEVLSSSEWKFTESFSPNYFVSISSEDANKKIKAMQKYESEISDFPFPRSVDGIMTLLKMRGMQSNSGFSEAFEVLRIIE